MNTHTMLASGKKLVLKKKIAAPVAHVTAKQVRRDKTRQLVELEALHHPIMFEGHAWCGMAHVEIAKSLGFSGRTLTRIVASPPFVRNETKIDGRNVTLLRVGIAEAMSERQRANELSRIWRGYTGRRTTEAEWGCLIGLVQVWGSIAPHLLKRTIKDWARFKSCVKFELVTEMIAAGVECFDRFHEFPSLTVMRRFWKAAILILQDDAQGEAAAKASKSGSLAPSDLPF